ncbi:MAG: AsmA family protein [Acidobacteria bacterium]|nr:AsmA family protein [Acidobacteriota bacterium]
MVRRLARKTVFAVPALLLLAAAVFVLVFVSRTSPEAVQRELERATGAQVRLEGVDRLWVGPGVAVHGLELAAAGYSLQADQLEVRLALLSLLRGRTKLKSIAVSGARLELLEHEQPPAALGLPLRSSWEIRELAIRAVAGREAKELFYVDRAFWTPQSGRTTSLELVGGATASAPSTLRLEGELRAWEGGQLPEAKLHLELNGFPAQPGLAFWLGEERLLADAQLQATLALRSEKGTAQGEGSLRALSPAGEELLALDVRLRARPDVLELESASGRLAGNALEASGKIDQWLGSDPRVALELKLPEARLEDDSLAQIEKLLGQPLPAFARQLRGAFAARLRLASSNGRPALRGDVDLKGLTYSVPGLPSLDDIHGRALVAGDRVTLQNVSARLLETRLAIAGHIHGDQLALELASQEIPLARLPFKPLGVAPPENLQGLARLNAAVAGTASNPLFSGTLTLLDAGFDFEGLPLRHLRGDVEFTPEQAILEDVRGRIGQCDFEAEASLEPAHWREAAKARAVLPACSLPALFELAEHRAAARIPGLEPATLEGTGTLTLDYERQQWRARLEVQGARWNPAWLGSPIEDLHASLEIDPGRVALKQVRGRLGQSPVSLRGEVALASASTSPWQVEFHAQLSPADAQVLLPAPWGAWLNFPTGLEARAQVSGTDGQAVTIEARLEIPAPLVASTANPSAAPAASGQVELRALWTPDAVQLERLTAQLGSGQLDLQGRILRSPVLAYDLRLRAPAGTSLADLLAFVRRPRALQSAQGQVEANIALAGPFEQPEWTGRVHLQQVRLPELLTEPVQLQGQVDLKPDGFHLDSIEFAQPRGMFQLSGLLRKSGLSTLRMAGEWINVDRFLNQLWQSGLSLPSNSFLAAHPLQVALAVERMKFQGLEFADVQAEFAQKDGAFTLEVPHFALESGRGRAQLALEPARDRLRASLEMNQVPLETLLVDYFKMEPLVRGALDLHVELTGPVGPRAEFVQDARGLMRFTLAPGRIQKGTLPERLFALAVMLHEGFYGFSLLRLGGLAKPTGLRHFQEWTGTLELEQGKANLVESRIQAQVYDVDLTGEVDLTTGALSMHGDGHFHPGFEFTLSLKNIVNMFARLFRLARGKHGHHFEFDVAGELAGPKHVQDFHFKD